jgi:predicted MFS family arabinose efflux permease
VRLAGGPLGGILLAVVGIRWLIYADALSYLLSGAAICLTSRTDGETAAGRTTVSDVIGDLRAGARVLRGEPVARGLLPVTVVFLAANASLSAVLIPFGVQRLAGTEHTGFLLAGLGAGVLLGAPLIRVLLDRIQPRYLLAASLSATAICYLMLFRSSSLAAALPAAAAVGLFGSMSLVTSQTALQRAIPPAVLGRACAVFGAGEAAATLFGAVAGPFLAQAAQPSGVAATAALVTFGAAALTLLLVPRVAPGIPVPPAA